MNFQPTGDVFRSYLFTGERVLWTGQPKQGMALSARDTFLIPFSLLWGGFAIFWNAMVWAVPFGNSGSDSGWFLKLWGLPFLVVGLYLIVGRFFYDAWVRARSYYAVTNERILILRKRPTPKLISRDIQSLPMFELSEHRNGSGTINFDSEEVGYSWLGRGPGFGAWTPAASANAQFFRIQNPRKVYEIIRNQAHA